MTSENPSYEESKPRPSRRQQRAEAVRRKALSPLRIFMMVLALPITTATIALGVYLRTTDYEHAEAVIHLVALAGCDAAHALGMGAVREGQPGYHKRNDPDGDGVACGTFVVENPTAVIPAPVPSSAPAPAQAEAPAQRRVGNAKFVKP
ncbi:excalibur calcium-binding domain-containing protein [Roseibium sp. RKSG952]|nr:excalibur calcium-binding domain-containing protein [Roseibium sp. RKSG952]